LSEQGDSGSPLVDEAAVQHGITSFGKMGCPAGTPAAFTQVSYYLDWIKENSDNYVKQKSLSH
jgi:secreted trypsin-like serine protease